MLFEGAGFPRFRVFRVGQQEARCIFQITFQRGVTLAVPAVFFASTYSAAIAGSDMFF
uniref:hypothetical protein n=1 Tax=Klebsiella pneumoniae TaxID=573 RepID=UPI0022BA4503|nr:hypothetical protein [Klebsiella pneumoniae]VXZ93154.1 Uncharacterised protein [Klebsiella pneumoniae]